VVFRAIVLPATVFALHLLGSIRCFRITSGFGCPINEETRFLARVDTWIRLAVFGALWAVGASDRSSFQAA
jgi:hypothetical protein